MTDDVGDQSHHIFRAVMLVLSLTFLTVTVALLLLDDGKSQVEVDTVTVDQGSVTPFQP